MSVEGTVIGGDFRVIRLLARGGMGAVYVAEQLSTGQQRALKLLLPQLAGDDKSRERFAAEARAPARVESEHVVETIAAGVDDATGMPWLAMELLRGEPLSARLARGPLDAREARRVLGELARGLAAAHRVGLVHRDLKPENVFLAEPRGGGASVVKILDFGIAKAVHSSTSGATSSGLGSPAWMAPEQANGEPITVATDVWAFGLVTYAALTGRTYWKATSLGEGTIQALLTELLVTPLVPASERARLVGVGLPRSFDAWFARTVTRSPADRFASIEACARALDDELSRADWSTTTVVRGSPDAPEEPRSSLVYAPTAPAVQVATAARATAPRRRLVATTALGLAGVGALGALLALRAWGPPRGTALEPAPSERPVSPPGAPTGAAAAPVSQEPLADRDAPSAPVSPSGARAPAAPTADATAMAQVSTSPGSAPSAKGGASARPPSGGDQGPFASMVRACIRENGSPESRARATTLTIEVGFTPSGAANMVRVAGDAEQVVRSCIVTKAQAFTYADRSSTRVFVVPYAPPPPSTAGVAPAPTSTSASTSTATSTATSPLKTW